MRTFVVAASIHAAAVVAILASSARPALAQPSAADPSVAGPPVEQPPLRPESARPKDDGLLGPLRVGAVVGVGVPTPLSVEGLVKIEDRVAVGLQYGVLPTISTSSGVDVRLDAVSADVLVFPFRGAFFVGVAGGHQHLDATGNVSVASLGTVSGEVTADTWFVTPKVGILWTSGFGLTIGADIGAQVPVSSTITNTIPPEYSLNQTATNAARVVGKDVFPSVDLLRLGWMF